MSYINCRDDWSLAEGYAKSGLDYGFRIIGYWIVGLRFVDYEFHLAQLKQIWGLSIR